MNKGVIMNKTKKMLCATALATSLATTPAVAGSDSFSGIFFDISSSAIGVELDGNHNDNQSNVTTGVLGKFAIIGGVSLGYSLPLGDTFAIDVGASFVPGEAKITSDNALSSDVSFEVKDHQTFYIAPSISLNESSAIYLKYGSSEADVAVTGDVTKPSNLDGETFAIGTKTLLGSAFYIKTEAGFTEYDQISSTGKGSTGGVSTGTTVTADPTIAFGTVSIGLKF